MTTETRTEAQAAAAFDGPGGARVEIFDLTRPYGYKNVYSVKLRAVARLPGSAHPFERLLERTGVFEPDLDRTRAELIESFRRTVLPYLFREGFAARLDAAVEARRPPEAGY